MLREARVDPVEPDPLEPLLPRLREPVPGLGAVPDDGEAPRRAAEQQHLPLGVGQLLRLVHDDVRERAGEQVRVGAGQRGLVDQGVLQVLPAQHRHHEHLGVVGRDQVVDDPGPSRSRSAATAASCRRLRRDASGSPSRCRAASRSGRSDTVQAWASARCSVRTSSGLEPGRAPAQVGGHRPQVADEVGRLEQRPRPVEASCAAPGSAAATCGAGRPGRRRRRACRPGS